ncbi:MAG: hypothetical protein AAGL89_05505 [Pseudomonadota bacterium]
MRSALIAAALGAFAQGAAACPTAADLASGIIVTEDNGIENLFQSVDDLIVAQSGTLQDGGRFRHLMVHGIHLTEIARADPGESLSKALLFDYDIPLEDLPVPEPGGQWDLQTFVNVSGDRFPERYASAWSDLTPMTIGGCTYDVLTGKLAYISADNTLLEVFYYVPELGFGLLETDEPNAVDPFTRTYIDIRAQ